MLPLASVWVITAGGGMAGSDFLSTADPSTLANRKYYQSVTF
jgi:hypothetical protein